MNGTQSRSADKPFAPRANHSKPLVRGRWWRVAGKILAPFAVPALPSSIFAVGISLLPQVRWLDLLSSFMAAVPFAFSSAGTTVLFLVLDAITDSPPEKAAPQSETDKNTPAKAIPIRDYDY